MREINDNLLPRPPIVVVMGHVDHGKTSLLDYIRKTNVTTKEAGGITQSIGAYEIIHAPHESRINADNQRISADVNQRKSAGDFSGDTRKITFIDTPGHEAFSKMRIRGTQVADLAILVVAADEGVKPQTKEALGQIQTAKLPFVVAINKIDKPNINLEKVKNELMTAGILLEGYGGNISWQAISAKTGQGVSELLDLILLAAELENLKYDSKASASGIIIETLLDNRRGTIASIIIKNGILRLGENIATPTASGKIKSLENFLGERVDSLGPSAPALILGFKSLPQTGEEFIAGARIDTNVSRISQISAPSRSLPIREISGQISEDSRVVKVILKADNSGSLEALCDVIKALPSTKPVEILGQSVGRINEGDFRLAIGAKALIIGFKTKLDPTADSLQRISPITIIASDIIYELVKKFEDYLKSFDKINASGELEVLAVFGKPEKKEQIVGGKIIQGLIKNQQKFEVWRNEQSFSKGRILNLQEQRKDVAEAGIGKEVGILTEADDIIKVGDKLKFYSQ